jgi:hypothetical protein
MTNRTLSPRVVVTIGVLAGAALLGGLTYERAEANTTFTGCLNAGGSITRVAIGTSPKGSCSPNETQISWNASGPAGPAGVLNFYKVTASFACPADAPANCLIDPLPVALCNAGDVATGGAGYRTVTIPAGVPLQDFAAIPYPAMDLSSSPPTGFTTTQQTIGKGDTVFVVAICANLP